MTGTLRSDDLTLLLEGSVHTLVLSGLIISLSFHLFDVCRSVVVLVAFNAAAIASLTCYFLTLPLLL